MNIAQHIEQAQDSFSNKLALIFEDQSFTYCELNELSNRVTNSLVKLGISRGDRVALFLPNIPPFVIVSLGIFKTGAIAVSINSTLKAEETKFILNDCEAKLVVTTETLRSQILAEELPHLNAILIAEGETKPTDIALNDWLTHASPQAMSVDLPPDEPAVILYTSGTTGFPKGATLSHANIISDVRMCVNTLQVQPDDRMLLCLPIFHSFGQTAALHPCLEVGATLVLHREFDIEPILNSIVTHKITIFHGVPSLYTLLCDNASVNQMQSVRCYMSGAATLPFTLATKWHDKFGVVINEGYGSTETSLVCFNNMMESKPGSVGLPLEGIEIKVVNADRPEVATEQLGEIIIRGPNVMLGYWNRAVETAKVLKNGWFHTGDIGKKDHDGYFYIIDRIKDMINVGGIKAYPSEIEHVLYQHPTVAEVAVYGVRDDILGEQVRASIVLKPNQAETTEEIINFCRQRMADFKVPSVIYFVDSLPKGRTGKILKRVLRDNVQEDNLQKNTLELQKSDKPLEEQLSEIWATVLGLEQIGLHDNFFKLGGNSFLAIQIIFKVRAILGMELSIRSLFEAPNVSELTQYIKRIEKHEQTMPTLKAVPREGNLPLSFFQQGIWLTVNQSEDQNHTYNIPLILHIQGELKTVVLEKAFNEMLRRHEILRTVFREADGEPIQVILPELPLPLLIKDVQNLSATEPETELRRLAVEEANKPFILSTGPLVRASLLKMGQNEQVLLITIHHIIVDFRSTEIFKHELATLYNAFFEGKASPLPELEIQYVDFAYWQRQSLTQKKLTTRLSYWKQLLATEPPPLELPTDRFRPSVETFRCGSEWSRLSPELTQKLIILSGQSGTTLFMTIMTAFVILICRWSDYKEIVVGTPFTDRNHPQLESLIGAFANTLLIRIDIKGNPSFMELLTQVRDVNLSALANQDVPFGYLVNTLQPQRNLRNNSPYRVLLNLLPSKPKKTLKFGGITVTSSETHHKTRRDLTLNFWEEKNGSETALHGMWRYKRELFDPDTIAGIAENFQTLLEAIVANPEQLLEQFPIGKFKRV